MKMYFATLCLCIIFNAFAMEEQPKREVKVVTNASSRKVIALLQKLAEGPVTEIHGIVDRNQSGGELQCKVSYNSSTNKYSGVLINRKYSIAEWHSQDLDEQTAQEYFEQLQIYPMDGLEELSKKELTENLFKFAKQGNLEVIKDLIQKGADVKVKNELGDTPLHVASSAGPSMSGMAFVRDLRKMEAQSEFGIPEEFSGFTRGLGSEKDELKKAATYVAIIHALMNAGAEVNEKNNLGRTPLDSAKMAQQTAIVRKALEAYNAVATMESI